MWLSATGVMLTLALLWAPLTAHAHQPEKVYRIVFLSAYAPPLPSEPTPILDAFRHQLQALGWLEGQNLVIEHRWAEMRFERLPALATELVQQQVDLILVGDGAAIQAAKQTTSTIPIVMFFSVDAVRQGFVASLAHPGANVTGLTATNTDLSAKRLELLKEMVPGSSRMAVLQCKAVPGQDYSGGQGVEEMQVTARALGIQLQLLEVREPEDYQGAFAAAISERAEAMLVLPCYYHGVNRQRIVDLAAQHRLPT